MVNVCICQRATPLSSHCSGRVQLFIPNTVDSLQRLVAARAAWLAQDGVYKTVYGSVRTIYSQIAQETGITSWDFLFFLASIFSNYDNAIEENVKLGKSFENKVLKNFLCKDVEHLDVDLIKKNQPCHDRFWSRKWSRTKIGSLTSTGSGMPLRTLWSVLKRPHPSPQQCSPCQSASATVTLTNQLFIIDNIWLHIL